MNKINYSTLFMGLLLIFSGWLNYLYRGDSCLGSGGGRIICGNLAIMVMVYITLGGLYLIYKSIKK